jgi:hypothetical protein
MKAEKTAKVVDVVSERRPLRDSLPVILVGSHVLAVKILESLVNGFREISQKLGAGASVVVRQVREPV